ncbi:MAG TPA: cyclic nucleotide-binding domain-containing protein [Anaeromyxobacter sp.]|nr:cyclic nucleotide-binding domain-containing protein [Anaeromyxobacter sp.]
MASVSREVLGDLAATAFVESNPLFRSLGAEERHDLLELARLVDFAAGELASGEGEESFILVLDGKGSAQLKGVEVAHLGRGATFGEGRVLGTGRPLALLAADDLTVVAFPAPMIAALAERHPKLKKLLEAVQAARDREIAARAPA